MGKKIKVTETTEEVIETEKKAEEPKAEEEPVEHKEEKKEEKKVESKPKEEKKVEKDAAPPVVEDDDISYVKQVMAKQMIDSLDVDTLKKFVVECEGKSLKQKAEWIAKNKPAPQPDPTKSLPKGAPGGKPLGPYDPGYKHVFVDNRPK